VQQGDNVMIGGFTILGETPKTVLIRAIGPSLAAHGLTSALLNPSINLHDGTGAVIASGSPWNPAWTDPERAPLDPREPVIQIILPPGNYTVILSGPPTQSGMALIEVFDLEATHGRLAAISTRSKVETGDNVMIGGFILGGDETGYVVIRALGPSLTQYGIEGALLDPALEVYDGNGSLIATNDNWRSHQEGELVASTIPPTDNREAAVAAILPPGGYTAIVRGQNHTVGVALVEVFHIVP
jgi:hypothetical protein